MVIAKDLAIVYVRRQHMKIKFLKIIRKKQKILKLFQDDFSFHLIKTFIYLKISNPIQIFFVVNITSIKFKHIKQAGLKYVT